MNLKEKLNNLRNKLLENQIEEIPHYVKRTDINLDRKVDNFIDWYLENMVRVDYIDIRNDFEYSMRKFIGKIAIWYELRYPDYEINRLMPGSTQEVTEINDVMFNNNEYINILFDKNADIRSLDWSEFYNAKVFIDSLPIEEKCLLNEAKYRSIAYIDQNYGSAHLHLTPKGYVKEAEKFTDYTDSKVKDEELEGMHIKDVVKLLKEKNIPLPDNNELEGSIEAVEKWNYQKEEILNCAMYRIIESGKTRIGPRRAFLFAKEFGRNIDIPMMYGVDYSDPGLRSFVIEYIKAGGSKELVCYMNYFSKTNQNKKIRTISVDEILKNRYHNSATKYTPEEEALYQRMVNTLSSQINQDELKKEEVKQLRLQRKLEKSRLASKIDN